ncbi:MAG: sigma-E processing peptidase SpoIIGA [Oscillospiraceae bacterium]|nr:sigma-E processing peptidase SpoIIGA [Oscillospiraceae bacterium]
MKCSVYADILIVINLFVNYFLLLATAKILYIKASRKKIILGSAVGAIYSLYIFLPESNFIISFLIKILMALTIVITVFGLKNKKILIKSFVCFLLVSFAFSGINFAMWLIFKPRGMLVRNGVVYFGISPVVLIISTVVSYIILKVMNRIIGKNSQKQDFCRIFVGIAEKVVSFDARIDTGNNLKEPFSNLPVIVARQSILEKILPINVGIVYDSEKKFDSVCKALGRNIRLIPFNTVSGCGVLCAFKPDLLIVETPGGKLKREGFVAVCPNEHMINDSAIVGKLIID